MIDRPKTLFIDIDGTLLFHHGCGNLQTNVQPIVLPGVYEKFDEWDRKGYKIFLITGRRESERRKTEEQLQSLCIVYDELIMGLGGGVRVLINDLKANTKTPTALAFCVDRNKGIRDIDV